MLDLLFDVPAMDRIIDELAAVVRPMAEADRRRWDYAPVMVDRYVVMAYIVMADRRQMGLRPAEGQQATHIFVRR